MIDSWSHELEWERETGITFFIVNVMFVKMPRI